jgi:hypothetical protein
MAADLNVLFISLAFYGDCDGLINHLHVKVCMALDHIHIHKFCKKQLCNMPKITDIWSMKYCEVPTDKFKVVTIYISTNYIAHLHISLSCITVTSCILISSLFTSPAFY